MMNNTYGFGSFRNKIWHKFWEDETFTNGYNPIYEKGYHMIFKPLVRIAESNRFGSSIVRKILEHMGRHVTADMWYVMKGKKRDTLGRIYRAIFEPICWCLGKIHEKLSTTKANK
jgi:hypothetical protein